MLCFGGMKAWEGLRVLDLYAGSGAVGLEARSRGAGHVTLVEHDRRTAALIKDNHVAVAGIDDAVMTGPALLKTLERDLNSLAPFVDYLCTDDYTVTITTPVRVSSFQVP